MCVTLSFITPAASTVHTHVQISPLPPVPLLTLSATAQISRIPWLKHKIREWCEANGVELPSDDGRAEALRGACTWPMQSLSGV